MSARADDTIPLPYHDQDFAASVTVVHPAPGIDYHSDQHGNSATIVEPMEGLRWYSTEDHNGRITSQGYLFDPMPRDKPLQVPESMRNYSPLPQSK